MAKRTGKKTNGQGTNTAKLLFDSSESADMLYAAKMRVPDPFLYLEHKGQRILVMSELEYERARIQAKGCLVLPLRTYQEKLRNGRRKPTLENIIDLVLKERKIKELVVPRDFPAWLYLKLAGKRYRVRTATEGIFPERECKSQEEIRYLEDAQRVNEGALEVALSMIRDASVKGGVLYLDGEALTSERVRRRLLHFYLDKDYGCPDGIIVSCGKHAALPHHQGAGPLYAGQPIILDLFPRSTETGYWADMTRTVVKGKASDDLRKMYQAVFDSQEHALSMIREGVLGSAVHAAVTKVLDENGFPTGIVGGSATGFIHGTGHGLGLEIHEAPRMGAAYANEKPLIEGQVVSVEPGLYYPGKGGVRIEDVVVVQKNGCRNLTAAKKVLEIP